MTETSSILTGSNASVHFSLGLPDLMILAFPLLLAFGVTIYMRRFTRSVADYLAAGRSAGRYLISTAQMEMGTSGILLVGSMEQFSQTGFSTNLWTGFIGFFYFLMAMSGLITYRFRETRALTFHQFLETRYSKGVRVFSTIINTLSSLLTMGIGPVVAARFFVYFLGMPIIVHASGLSIPTVALVMIAVTAISLYFAFAGGHLTIMTTDCIEGVISSFFYLVIAFAILCLFSYHQMGQALSAGKPGESYLDPFDIGKRPSFDYTFLLLSWAMTIYYWRGNAWNASFAASAKSAHEGQMAVVLGTWRSMGATAMGGLIGLGAFTLMHSPDFAEHAAMVRSYLQTTIPDTDAQLRTELLLPTALGVLLPVGVKGALCGVLLMGMVAASAAAIHQFSCGIVQDIILPFTKARLEPAHQIRLLRVTAIVLAIYSIVFGLVFKFNDYLVFVTQLMSAIYLAGIGCVVWGGLYWKRSSRLGAWASLLAGSILASAGVLLQQFWTSLVPMLYRHIQAGPVSNYLHTNAGKMPVNGQVLSACIMAVCLMVFIAVSLITCRIPYDMDKLLHRGKYQVAGEKKVAIREGFQLRKLAGINENFNLGDRRIAYFTFIYGLLPNVIGIAVVIWNVGYKRWTWQQWWAWNYVWAVAIPIIGGVITTIWFSWGVTRDMLQLFKDLKSEKIDINDDGQIRPPVDTPPIRLEDAAMP